MWKRTSTSAREARDWSSGGKMWCGDVNLFEKEPIEKSSLRQRCLCSSVPFLVVPFTPNPSGRFMMVARDVGSAGGSASSVRGFDTSG